MENVSLQQAYSAYCFTIILCFPKSPDSGLFSSAEISVLSYPNLEIFGFRFNIKI